MFIETERTDDSYFGWHQKVVLSLFLFLFNEPDVLGNSTKNSTNSNCMNELLYL